MAADGFYGWFGPRKAPGKGTWYDVHPRIDTPNAKCVRCRKQFKVGDEGLMMPFIGKGGVASPCYYHVSCFLNLIVGI